MKYPVAKPHIDQKDIDGVVSVMKTGTLALGPQYIEFEKRLCTYTGSKFCAVVSSGTSGLHLAVRALGLKEGDEVITTPFSFIASVNCLLYEKVTPVFVDIADNGRYGIDVKKIKKKITKKTKAILPIHLFGHACDIESIMNIAKEYNLKVIEDACEGVGTRVGQKHVGTFGNVGVLAFYPNKQMTTGEGGAIITDSEEVYELCRSLRNQGRNVYGDWLVHERLGYNYRMNEMEASLGITQLNKLDWMIKEKQQIVDWYSGSLNHPHIETPKTHASYTPSWFVYVIRVKNGKRDHLIHELQKKGIQSKPYFPTIHEQTYIQEMLKLHTGDFPLSEMIASQTVALPFYIGLTYNDIQYIAAQILAILHAT